MSNQQPQNVKVIYPKFNKERGEKDTDFNDLAKNEGLEAVRQSFNSDDEGFTSSPYIMNDEGLFIERITRNGSVWVKICTPFKILGEARNIEQSQWGLLICFKDPDSFAKEYLILYVDCKKDKLKVCSELAGLGLKIMPKMDDAFIQYLYETPIRARILLTDKTGYLLKDDNFCFVLPHITIGNKGDEIVKFMGKSAAYANLCTLVEWQTSIGLEAGKHRLLALMLSAALTGVMLEICGAEGGGINLYGQSSKGKTTSLECAASVWGKGSTQNGFIKTWRSTANALEATALLHNHTLLCLDEISLVKGDELYQSVYTLAGGVSKGRASLTGDLRPQSSWQLFILSTGEEKVFDKISESGKKAKAGQAVRFIDLSCDAENGFGIFDNIEGYENANILAQTLKKACVSTYGTAGEAFLSKLLSDDLDALKIKFKSFTRQFINQHCPKDADGQIMRVAQKFALIAFTGELAIEFQIYPWKEKTALNASEWAFKRWYDERGTNGGQEDDDALSTLRRFILENEHNRFDHINYYEGMTSMPSKSRVGYKIVKGTECFYLFFAESFKEVMKGHDAKAALKLLKQQGYLKTEGEKNLLMRHKINGVTYKGYHVKQSIIDEKD